MRVWDFFPNIFVPEESRRYLREKKPNDYSCRYSYQMMVHDKRHKENPPVFGIKNR
ncbi:MAG: hypothetical protein JXA44_07455 [Methanospirillaceae archaeon]|nr:hypothetical protein [Methanospirillaceae archaeon]